MINNWPNQIRSARVAHDGEYVSGRPRGCPARRPRSRSTAADDTATVPDDVKSVAVQTLADENDNRESCDSGTGPRTVAAPRVCPACRRAPASWRACGECQRICADGGSSNGDDDDELPPSRTLAKCLLRSKSRCLFRTWRSGVRSCAKERRDVMKATTHRVGVIFRTWRQAKRSIRAAEHAELKAVTHHRKRTLKSLLAAWRRFNQTAFYVNHRLRSRHQTKVTDGALARYVRVRNLAPAWRAWWIFHVQCATARDCINHLGEATLAGVLPAIRGVRQVEDVHALDEARTDGARGRRGGRQG